MTSHTYVGMCRLRDGRKIKFELQFAERDDELNIAEAQMAIADHVGQSRVGTILIGVPTTKEWPEPARA